MPLIISILHAKMFAKRGKKAKKSLESTKSSIFSFFSHLNASEISYLFALLLDKLPIASQTATNSAFSLLDSRSFLAKVALLPLKSWLGFLHTFAFIFRSFDQGLLQPHFSQLIILLLSMMKLANLFGNSLDEVEESRDESCKKFFKAKFKEINKLSLDRLCEIYEKFPQFPHFSLVTRAFLQIKLAKIRKMPLQAQGCAGFLRIFRVWSQNPRLLDFFVEFPEIKRCIFAVFCAKGLKSPVLALVNEISLNLLDFFGDRADSRVFDRETVQFLVEKLENLLISQRNVRKSRRNTYKPSAELIKILLILCENYSDCLENRHIDSFCLIFLPLLAPSSTVSRRSAGFPWKRAKSRENLEQILTMFAKLLEIKRTRDNVAKIFNNLCALLMSFEASALRMRLCACFRALLRGNLVDLSENGVVFLENLNVFARNLEKSYDLDHVIPQLSRIVGKTQSLRDFATSDVQMLVSHVFSLLDCEEMALRGVSVEFFGVFFEFLSENWPDYRENERKHWRKLVEMTFLPALIAKIKRNSNANPSEEYKLRSFFTVIGFLLEFYRENAGFLQGNELFCRDLQVLLNKNDSEQDFFALIFHAKISKKNQGLMLLLKKLRGSLENSHENPKEYSENLENSHENRENPPNPQAKAPLFCLETTNKLLFPLLFYLIFQKSQEIHDPLKKMPRSEATISNYKTLLENCVEVLALLTKSFKWSSFQRILKNLMNLLEKRESLEKILVKIICALLNNLDFELNDVVSCVEREIQRNREGFLKRISLFSGFDAGNSQENEGFVEKSLENAKRDEIIVERNAVKLEDLGENRENQEKNSMYYFLRTKVLIPLKHHMYEAKKNRNVVQDEQKIRVYLTVAITKVSIFYCKIDNYR